jgi:uncharacterized LabA/DUF88 family protein
MEKSVVLIDAENVRIAWIQKFNQTPYPKLNYAKLVSLLSENTNLLRAYFYDGVQLDIHPKKRFFLESLQKQGIQIRSKTLRTRTIHCKNCNSSTTTSVQKGVDVSLATDILRHAYQHTCDICIVVSGDEDFKDAIEVAKDKGIRVWVASFESALSKEMRMCADKIILLDNFIEKFTAKIE